jgi:hypothetical protein
MRLKLAQPLGLAVFLSVIGTAGAQELQRTPLPPGHPLLGSWRIDFPQLKCFEEYEVRADGSKLSRSGEERNESMFSISAVPSAAGYYKWIDKITKGNDRPDCHGQKTPLGNVAVNYVRLHPTGTRFLLCQAEEMKSCYAEFMRSEKK